MWPTAFDGATDTLDADAGSISFLYSPTDLPLNQESNREADLLALASSTCTARPSETSAHLAYVVTGVGQHSDGANP
jgi:hypothetical protein